MRCCWALLLVVGVGCKPQPERAEERRAVLADDSSEPPPHYQEHPNVTSDELGERPHEEIDSGAAPTIAAADCPMSEPPPARPHKRIRSGPPVTNYIPPEIIMRPIRGRAACFRGCYQAGLARDATLGGRIVIRFVIEQDGWVRRARVVENELGDADVSECIRRAFVGLAYPSPDGEDITVVYPLVFARDAK